MLKQANLTVLQVTIPPSGRLHSRPIIDLKPFCAITEGLEQKSFCAGQPGLPAKVAELVEESGPPVGIEMGRSFIKQQDRVTEFLLISAILATQFLCTIY